jgi:hypothetical protein
MAGGDVRQRVEDRKRRRTEVIAVTRSLFGAVETYRVAARNRQRAVTRRVATIALSNLVPVLAMWIFASGTMAWSFVIAWSTAILATAGATVLVTVLRSRRDPEAESARAGLEKALSIASQLEEHATLRLADRARLRTQIVEGEALLRDVGGRSTDRSRNAGLISNRLGSGDPFPTIEATLFVLHRVICALSGIDGGLVKRGKLRLTVHRVDGEELVQAIPYVGGDGGPAGRRFSIRTGIIGRAALTGRPHIARRTGDNPDQFTEELIAEWHFTRAEAERVARDRRAWMAVPLRGRAGIVAIVFLDSNDDAMFSPTVQEIVIAACAGIATFLEARYTDVGRV